MTIFLTTQYLEEADVLAHRVGIINRGRLVAEGTPETLKRSIADDVIVVEVDGSRRSDVLARLGPAARGALGEREGDRITIRPSTAGRSQPVAVALATAGLEVRSITMRTPTLDDVFLELTGDPIEEAA